MGDRSVPVVHNNPAAHRRLLASAINRIFGELDVLDYGLAVARNLIPGTAAVNKFGRCADNVDLGTASDIWDGANAATGTKTWVAPTQARVHDIASTSASDDGSPAGAGARTIRVYGLTDWDTKEVFEDITMNGVSNVATNNSYVIIHRMKVLTKGATNVNVGVITATAQTDGTVTAQINAGEGQTQMAIYGVPSNQKFYMTDFYAAVNRAVSGSVDIRIYVNPEPDTELLNFLTKSTIAINSTGSSFAQNNYEPPNCYDGPCIIKMTGVGSANNMDVSAGFDGYLVDN